MNERRSLIKTHRVADSIHAWSKIVEIFEWLDVASRDLLGVGKNHYWFTKTIIGAQLIGLTIASTGCAKVGEILDKFAFPTPLVKTDSTLVITQAQPAEIKTVSTSTPSEMVLGTITPAVLDRMPYPKSADNFIKSPSVSGSAAEKLIKDTLNAGDDLDAVKNWYKTVGILGSGSSNFAVPVVYIGEGGESYWNVMVKSGSGEFVKFTLASGPEANELVRAMGMVNYLDTEPSFETSNLSDPPGLTGLNQQIIWDKSGWSVVGAFQGDTLIAWFNADAPNGGEWVKIQELVPTPTQEVIEISFDTSRPETISAVDGNSYQGYLIEDEYGSRLVDETNRIILIKDGDTWRPAESANFSEEYPAVFWETKIGMADGFEIPITLGLAANAKEGVGFNFSEIHMTQLGADSVASRYLSDAWCRYRIVMNHPDTTYEEYLKLLNEGEGNFSVYDAIEKKDTLVDPRQGVSFVITGNRAKSMPIWRYDVSAVYFDSDEKGKLLVANNEAYQYHQLFGHEDIYRDINVRSVMFAVGSTYLLTYYPDRCFKSGGVELVCADIEEPLFIVEESHSLLHINYNLYNKYESDDPLFILK